MDFDVCWIPALIRTSRYKGRAEKADAPEADAPAPKAKVKPARKGAYQGKH